MRGHIHNFSRLDRKPQDRRCRNFCSTQGFTLLELLLCVAIALLASALVLPAISRSSADATLDACLNHQRQIAVGWAQFGAEHGIVAANMNDSLTARTQRADDYQYGSYAVWLQDMEREDQSMLVGAGRFLPYVQNTTVYTCPGNPAGDDFFKRFLHTDPLRPYQGAWGRAGFNAYSTYYYRGGVYYREAYPFPESGVDHQYTFSTMKKPDEPTVQGRPFLTCHWTQGRFELAARTGINHGGDKANLAYPDGSAVTWQLPEGVLPLMSWYERQGPEVFRETDYANDFYKQLPLWWVKADQRDR